MTNSANPPEETVSFELNPNETVMYRPGDLVGESYSLISLIAVGGMGVVYQARHLQLDRLFAIKLLEPRQMTEVNWRRFEFEAKTLAKLQHPNIVQIYNMGIDQRGCPYCVMELLHGSTISEYLKQNDKMPLNQFLQCFADICSALKLAHSKNIVHRDIKPSNLILEVAENSDIRNTKVVDFGIARSIEVNERSAQSLTSAGQAFGTPQYMSPEQTHGLPVSPASDIYSLGCTMFEAFTGAPPFQGKSGFETMVMHQSAPVPEIFRSDCSESDLESIRVIINTCMEKNPSDRFSNVDQITELLSEILNSTRRNILFDFDRHDKQTGEAYSSTAKGPVQEPDSKDSNSNLFAKPILIWGFVSSLILIVLAANAYLSSQNNPATVSKTKPLKKTSRKPPTSGPHVSQKVDSFPELDMQIKVDEKFISSTTPVSKVISIDGRRVRQFTFSPTDKVANIILTLPPRAIAASGQFTLPENQSIHFVAGNVLSRYPQFYRRFDDEAINHLTIKNTPSPPAIETLRRWKKLEELSIYGSELDDSYVRGLNTLPKLERLTLALAHFSKTTLIESGVLTKLRGLAIAEVNMNCTPILKALAKSKQLNYLALREVILTPGNF
ncbi:MAG: serine/threonine-protein kinase [Candidatus Melainabacteria bacterium]|nr:serine/threonine-protein kinase [Candidatus Melainabacteria bacterium]